MFCEKREEKYEWRDDPFRNGIHKVEIDKDYSDPCHNAKCLISLICIVGLIIYIMIR